MLNSFFSYFTPDETVFIEPDVSVANIVYGNGFPADGRLSSRIGHNKDAGTATFYFNQCKPVVIDCDRVIKETIISDEAGCPSSFDAICHYQGGEYSVESGLKVEDTKSWFSWGGSEAINEAVVPQIPSTEQLESIRKLNELRIENEALSIANELLEAELNKGFFQQGLEWLGVANFVDYNQDGIFSLDDIKDAASENPMVVMALAIAAIPVAYVVGKTVISAGKAAGSASKDVAVASLDAALFIPRKAYTKAFGASSPVQIIEEPKSEAVEHHKSLTSKM
tara:strand:- start:1441 stop:2283 length:843 start_codon:yes stop_codon:yes gene_type:complete